MHHPEEVLVARYAEVTAYVSLALAALGLIGNAFCFRMMINRRLQGITCSVFLLALCVTDTVVLVYEVLDDLSQLLPGYTEYDLLVGANAWRCRFGTFFFESSKIISAWLVVAMAAELCMVAINSERKHLVYMRKRAVYVTFAVMLVSVAGCFPFLVISSPPEVGVLGMCTSKYRVFYAVYTWFVLRAATQVAFPLLIIVGCNVASILLDPRKKHIKYGSNGPMSGSGAVDMQEQEGLGREKKALQAKSVVLATTFIYVVAVIPSGAIQTLFAVEAFKEDFSLLPKQDWFCAYYVAQTVLLLAYASKFFVVLILGPEFRHALGMKLSTLEQADHSVNLNYIPNGSLPRQNHRSNFSTLDF